MAQDRPGRFTFFNRTIAETGNVMRQFTLLIAFSAMLYVGAAGAQPTPAGLLPIDEAYQVTAGVKTPGVVIVHWKIAEGYYLYRDQMKFVAGKGIALGEAKLPDGAKFHDEFLGDVQIYHDAVDALVPYTAAAGTATIRLSVGYQGCHETEPKLCYPPHTKSFDVPVAGSVSASSAAPAQTEKSAPRTFEARYEGSPEAQAAFKQADTARKAGKIDEAVKGYKKAIELDPNYAKAHAEYVLYERSHDTMVVMFDFAKSSKMTKEERKASEQKTRKADLTHEKALIDSYSKLMAEHPDQAIYPWALGLVYNESDLARQQELCEKAVKIDPTFAQGYECLALSAGIRDTAAKALEYQRKAFDLAPDDEEIAGLYAYMLGESGKADPVQIKALLQKFPDSYPIAMTLTDHANALSPESARVAALEQLRTDAPAASKPAAYFAAEHLYSIYIDSDLERAQKLCADLAGPDKKNPQWAGRLAYVEAIIKARAAVAEGHPAVALTALKSVEAQKDQASDAQWFLAQAQALDSAGKTNEAIVVLRDSFVVAPSDNILDALRKYEAKIGKTPAQIDADIWTGYQAKAEPAKPLQLKRLDNGQTVSLAAFKGKPVIVDFWYPNCGPCRAAFPYLQTIAAKYKDRGVTVLAVTSIKEQEPFALPYLVQKRYDFVGLAGSEEFARIWDVDSYPTTFLIGADGRVYMKPTLYDAAHQRSTELAVEQLLAHGS
jgi:thiol-disulfide isomerase/thioredoxin/Tfp pilus assembly protein PilF